MKRFLILFLSLLFLFSIAAEEESGKRPTFALVLGGGGARGYAHIPVIQELEKRGIVPDYVIGTSMGALIGGFYSAGWTGEDLVELALESDINSLLSNYNLNTGKMELVTPDSEIITNIASVNFGNTGFGSVSGLINDQSINGFIRNNLSKVLNITDFDELSVPFRAIGTDATKGTEIVFDDGDLFVALRSSMSLPLAFPPVQLDDDTFVMDGGMVNNLPVSVAKDLGADIVLAVDVNDAKRQNEVVSSDKFNTLTGAFDLFTSTMTVSNMLDSYDMADLVLVPDVDDYSTLDFNKAEEIMKKGKEEVEEHKAFFDYLESLLKDGSRDYLTYSERPSALIKSIDSNGVRGFDELLDSFVGMEINNINMRRFEELLNHILETLRLKGLSYVVDKEGNMKLQPDYYQNMSGYVAVGLSAELGLLFNGKQPVFFGYNAHLSVGAQYFLNQKALFSLGLMYNDEFKLELRYSLPVMRDTYFGVGLDFNYLNQSISTITTSYGFQVGNDIGFKALVGLFYDPQSNFTTSLSINYDFAHLGQFLNPNDRADVLVSSNSNGFLALSGAIRYQDEKKMGFIYSLSAEAKASFGLDYTYAGLERFENKPKFGYTISGKLESTFGGGTFKGFLDSEFDILRRYPKLKEAFVTTKSGILTPDYIYLVFGSRVDVPESKIYLNMGFYTEAFQALLNKTSDYWNENISPWPFANINDWAVGLMAGFGYKTSVGNFYVAAHLGYAFRENFVCSVMFGFK